MNTHIKNIRLEWEKQSRQNNTPYFFIISGQPLIITQIRGSRQGKLTTLYIQTLKVIKGSVIIEHYKLDSKNNLIFIDSNRASKEDVIRYQHYIKESKQ